MSCFEKVDFWLKIAGGQKIPAAGEGMICLPRQKFFLDNDPHHTRHTWYNLETFFDGMRSLTSYYKGNSLIEKCVILKKGLKTKQQS